ncbi:alpha/beta fold hydrolase [Rhodocista pekingensis]|uniref:Alpha/beta fold hydrolase n=1 Tax=Rhodocista pekingensis TaxID=201185 RepID=A0ABW2KPE8_9PROT
MDGPKSRFAQTNGIRMHYLEMGEGPLVLLCHGWPELSWSWRHQLPALAAAGFRVVAPDMRGFGDTDAPEAVEAYTLLHTTGDMVGLLEALGEEQAVIVGHDWGAPVAWQCALFRPDRFRAVAGLSVPYSPRGSVSLITLLRAMGLERFYMVYFQEPGQAERELEADPRETFLRLLYSASGAAAATGAGWPAMIPPGRTIVEACARPDALPGWLAEEDLARYAQTYARTGFRGGLNWYRTLHRTWELTAAWAGARIRVPALFIAGAEDGVLKMPGLDKAVQQLDDTCLDLRGRHILPGAGHWVQQEAPEAVNEALIGFLTGL